ncbi:HAD-IA family hydrolase, partial [Candidatus Sumerlaeota bacterium]|nr:HAD-IA family hydrolase [Candidatus Sumerlaeota bacterium]
SVTNPKPHPEIYLKAAAEIGVAPENCWIFEDSHHGAAAARAAGAKVIGLATTLPIGAIGPVHATISDYRDLESLQRIISLCEAL